MVHELLFHELLLVTLLWLGACIYWRWQRGHVTKPPPDHRAGRPLQVLKSFAGLTTRPPCEACAQAPDPGDQPPFPPPPLITPRRGRPRTVDTHTHYCPHKTCPYYGWVGHGNLRANGHPGGGPWRQLHCVGCDTYFLETCGTLLYGKPRPADRLVRAVAALAEGLGIRAVGRVFDLDPNTVLAESGKNRGRSWRPRRARSPKRF
jgi:hypothetical protein